MGLQEVMTDPAKTIYEAGGVESYRPLRVAISAGEPSGERQAAALVAALRLLVAPRQVEAWGIGGASMAAEGVRVVFDSTPWATIGFLPTIAHLPYLLRRRTEFKRLLEKNPPDVLVLVDSGAFNVSIGRFAKGRRLCPVFYYFPPGSWRRPTTTKARQTKSSLADAADLIVTPFPWSAEMLIRSGVNAEFVGHPLLDLVQPKLSPAEFYNQFGLESRRPVVALLPGSRRAEIMHILPALIGAAGEIARRIPGVQFVVALLSPEVRPLVEKIIRREQGHGGQAARLQLFIHQAGDRLAHIAQATLTPPLTRLATNEGVTVAANLPDGDPPLRGRSAPPQAPLIICEGMTIDVMACSDIVITKSGTSTLEAAILRRPMIIVYRGSALMGIEWMVRKRALNIQHIGVPNILAERRVFPELIGQDASPEAIAELAVEMILQPDRLLALKEQLGHLVRTNLGTPGGVGRAAELLLKTARAETKTEE